MHSLWPNSSSEELSDLALEQVYAYPDGLDRPWLQANFVSSLDGAVTVGGMSSPLTGPGDQRVLNIHRDLADVLLVGATTARVERYPGLKPNEARDERRARLQLSPLPPIAVVSGRCSVTPDSPLLTDTVVPPIVLTCADSLASRREALTAAGADVVIVGQDQVDLAAALAELDKRGLRRINCEGGPRLFGNLIAADLVDELCLTVSPQAAAGDGGRIANGPVLPDLRRFQLSAVVRDGDFLMLTYRR
ncbi:5-amino-6-(5-phosphoribosylamino)uracil reductase [Kibdelosporangium banguiense]|uniref:5-amino-6-(5-phosphoribosylamino)uracil reductase n=1 Tax=Kibdelosporangium banguiense TaxID=1365924 RepID=A0ABS4U1W4_9PSEU|nr:pyrimidine reductase family protein [Kibdelosporangium banguiense]MBP2330610.1 5-amino-6-(5-phosphoribosylamino)uracil reductase [Kibdelosporangium banguiense]